MLCPGSGVQLHTTFVQHAMFAKDSCGHASSMPSMWWRLSQHGSVRILLANWVDSKVVVDKMRFTDEVHASTFKKWFCSLCLGCMMKTYVLYLHVQFKLDKMQLIPDEKHAEALRLEPLHCAVHGRPFIRLQGQSELRGTFILHHVPMRGSRNRRPEKRRLP